MFKTALGWVRQARIHSLLILVCVAAVFGFGLLYHLGTSPNGLSPAGLAYKNSAHSLRTIYHNPLNAPHKVVEYIFIKAGLTGHFPLRLTSAIFALIFIASFYILARNWFGKSIGFFSTILFFSNPILIIAGRQASAEIMFFCPLAIMASYYWLLRDERTKTLAWLVLALVCGLFIYVPGMVWWLVGAAILMRKKLTAVISELPSWLLSVGVAIFVILLVPAGLSIFNEWRLVKDFALIPAHWPSPIHLLKNLGWMLSSLVVKTPYHSDLITSRLPILNIIQIALLAFGSYAMWTAARSKAIVLAVSVAFSVVAAAINDNINLLILGLPAVAIFIAAGVRYLYIEWKGVFPTNPIPRTLAMVLIACLVLTQLAFGLSYSLVAWPHSLATKTTYVLK